jgi:queuosine precursor transporter
MPTELSIITRPADFSREPRFYDAISVLFVAVYLISQVASTKIISIGPLQLPGAIIIFPIAYIFGDILTEVYGYARTRRVIWLGFISAAFMAVVLMAVQYLPAGGRWDAQAAYDTILGFVPRIVLGSVLAYWAGEFANSYVLATMKLWTKGKMLWTRTIGSTIIGQAVDSVVFAAIAFGGTMPTPTLLKIMGSIYVVKVGYEIVATPITYWVVNGLKRAEGVDIYDYGTNFTPFRFGTLQGGVHEDRS